MTFAELSPTAQGAIVDVTLGLPAPDITPAVRAELTAWINDPQNFTPEPVEPTTSCSS